MKWLFFLILYTIISTVGLSQGSKKKIRQFVNAVIPDSDSIAYVSNSLSSYAIKEIIDELKEDTLKNSFDYNKSDEINIFIPSNKERNKINKALRKLSGFRWSKKYFHNMKIIGRDSLDFIFKDRKNLGWNYFHKEYGEGYYSFSKPIFFRKNTISIFYSSYNCGGLCGGGQLDLYRKINDQWQLYFTLYMWIS